MIFECVRSCKFYQKLRLASGFTLTKSKGTVPLQDVPLIGQRIVTHVPVGFCTKFGDFHPVMHHFVSCSNVYLTIIVKYEDDHHKL